MLAGDKYAVIPIGLSCQPAYQLSRHKDVWSDHFNEQFRYESSLFNWIVSDPSSLPRLLTMLERRPLSAEDIDIDRSPTIRGMNFWMVHEDVHQPNHLNAEEKQRIISKYNHLRDKFLALSRYSRRLFVICNSDFNIRRYHMWQDGRLSLVFSHRLLQEISAAIDAFFPTGANDILVAAARDFSGTIDWSFPTVIMERSNDWRGNDRDWMALAAMAGNRRFGSRTLAERLRRFLPATVPATATTLRFSGRFDGMRFVTATLGNDCIIFTGEKGMGFYGPYIRLFAGNYEVRIAFDAAGVSGTADMEVVGSLGQHILGRRLIQSESLTGNLQAILRVVMPEDMSYVEIRLIGETGFCARVERIEIERLI